MREGRRRRRLEEQVKKFETLLWVFADYDSILKIVNFITRYFGNELENVTFTFTVF